MEKVARRESRSQERARDMDTGRMEVGREFAFGKQNLEVGPLQDVPVHKPCQMLRGWVVYSE